MFPHSTRSTAWLLLIPIASALLGGGCNLRDCVEGSGEITSQTRTVNSFDAVTVDGDLDLIVRQDTGTSVRIEADENLLSYITTTVSGTTLTVGSSRCLSTPGTIKVYVSMPAVRALEMDGSGKISSDGILHGDAIRCELDGSGEIDLQVSTTALTSDLSGSGELRLRGAATAHTTSLSGSGEIQALELATENSSVEISGSGDARVAVIRKLGAFVSGSGTIYYKGDPAEIQSEVNGSGRIVKIP